MTLDFFSAKLCNPAKGLADHPLCSRHYFSCQFETLLEKEYCSHRCYSRSVESAPCYIFTA